MSSHEWLSIVAQGMLLAIPAVFLLGSFQSPRRAGAIGSVALGLALCASLLGIKEVRALPRGAVQMDLVTYTVVLLVCGIGFLIARYSRTYLDGDAGQPRYFRALDLTLASVTTLVVTRNLLLIAMAWTATSIALHQLLTFYGQRSVAQLAAHKKFLVSRLADVCLWSALALVYMSVGSLDVHKVSLWANAHPALSPIMHGAAVLVVLAVALRSAQLPFHGWLIQVMEAPTPVSALLHAGVVNVGAVVLIRLAPWMAHAWAARVLLVVIGLITAVTAALVMTTRISVKVALAWSTCAQMGFMLVQCGLGLWHLALLHLVAHSLYKAHAFLSAGAAVDGWRLRQFMPAAKRTSLLTLSSVATLSVGTMLAAVALLAPEKSEVGFSNWVLATLVGLSLTPVLAKRAVSGVVSMFTGIASATAIAVFYFMWHAAAARFLSQVPSDTGAATTLGWALVGAGMLGLFLVKTILALRPQGQLARTLYPWLFAGFYLDEHFTRLTFRLWPPRRQQTNSNAVVRNPVTAEASL